MMQLLPTMLSLLLLLASPALSKPLKVTTGVDFVSNDAAAPAASGEQPKLVNGEYTRVLVRLDNEEAAPVIVEYIGASLFDAAKGATVKNFTSLKVGHTIESNLRLEQPYQFVADMTEQELWLQISLVLTTAQNEIVTVQAYNSTVAIVEPESSMFDPQMLFLYLVLAAAFSGAGYAAYTTWLASVAPAKGSRRRFDEPKPVAPVALASGKYEESWIPEHHLRPTTRSARGKKSATASTE